MQDKTSKMIRKKTQWSYNPLALTRFFLEDDNIIGETQHVADETTISLFEKVVHTIAVTTVSNFSGGTSMLINKR